MPLSASHRSRIVFITGTDTGVGKTLLTALLLQHLREDGCHALAMKPFCSGGTGDVDLLGKVMRGELSAAEINPYYYPEPVAPLVSARKHRRPVRLAEVVRSARALERRCDCLLIEGSGGLLVPLGEGFSALQVITLLRCETVVVARNRLGVINHALLTLSVLRAAGLNEAKVALMGAARADASAASNRRMLCELASPAPVVSLPYLGRGCASLPAVRRHALKVRCALAELAREA
jgi:dethiobiotin synthetase